MFHYFLLKFLNKIMGYRGTVWSFYKCSGPFDTRFCLPNSLQCSVQRIQKLSIGGWIFCFFGEAIGLFGLGYRVSLLDFRISQKENSSSAVLLCDRVSDLTFPLMADCSSWLTTISPISESGLPSDCCLWSKLWGKNGWILKSKKKLLSSNNCRCEYETTTGLPHFDIWIYLHWN